MGLEIKLGGAGVSPAPLFLSNSFDKNFKD